MVEQERESNGKGVVATEPSAKSVNGFRLVPGSNGFRTYKRRKYSTTNGFGAKLVENGKVHINSTSQFTDKESLARMASHTSVINSDNRPSKDWRNTVLEQMHQSLDVSEGGLRDCVQEAIKFLSDRGCKTASKKFSSYNHKLPSDAGLMVNGCSNGTNGNGCVSTVTSSGSMNESSPQTTNGLFYHAFFSVITSEKFTQLCNLLGENFQGLRVDSLLDICAIDSKLRDGKYGTSPMLFHSDVQQVWSKLQKVGDDIVALAKSLSEESRDYCQKVAGSIDGTSADRKNQLRQEFAIVTKSEQAEVCGIYSMSTCWHCGEKADGRDCLVCDSCEEMYHVSCIEPAVVEIPQKSWYCSNCTTKGEESPHENCVVCERLNTLVSRVDEDDEIQTNEATLLELDESSTDLGCCGICGSKVVQSDKFKVCDHTFCPHNYYHIRCLTAKQLNSYGPCWYCPSCLCRSCLTDRDDDKIVLCDSCDQAYHIYCMQPPLTSIPRGKWFCWKCDAGIQRIRKAKIAYESMQIKLKEQVDKGKGKYGDFRYASRTLCDDPFDKSGGVDMLLTAAKTLNY